jgi:hypothetical protein
MKKNEAISVTICKPNFSWVANLISVGYRRAELHALSLSDLTMKETDSSASGEKTISKKLFSLSFVLTENSVFYFFSVMD